MRSTARTQSLHAGSSSSRRRCADGGRVTRALARHTSLGSLALPGSALAPRPLPSPGRRSFSDWSRTGSGSTCRASSSLRAGALSHALWSWLRVGALAPREEPRGVRSPCSLAASHLQVPGHCDAPLPLLHHARAFGAAHRHGARRAGGLEPARPSAASHVQARQQRLGMGGNALCVHPRRLAPLARACRLAAYSFSAAQTRYRGCVGSVSARHA